MTTSPRIPATARVQSRTVALLSAAQIFSGISTGAVLATGSLLAVELSGSQSWAGAAATVMTLGAAAGSALLARLVPVGGRRLALSAGLLVAFAGTLTVIAAAWLGIFTLFLLGGALIGFASSVNLQARFAATDLSRPERRGRDLSLVVWMTTVGSVAGPNLIGAGDRLATVLSLPSLAGVFVIAAAGLLIGMAVLWLGLRPDPHLTALALASEGSAVREETAGPKSGLRVLARLPAARTALLGILSAHAVMVAVMSMTPLHMTGHGAAVTVVGLTVSLHIAGMYVFAPVMGMLSDRLGARAVLAGGQAVLLLAAVVSGLSGSAHGLTTVGLVLLGLGWSAATVAGSSMLVVAVPPGSRVAAQGASDALMSLAGAAGGALAGVVLSGIGFSGLGLVCAAVSLATLTLVLLRKAAP